MLTRGRGATRPRLSFYAPLMGRKYRRSAAYLNVKVKGKRCWSCGNWASQRDHRPPLALHRHVEGSGCCVIWPACERCNTTEGRAIQNLGRAAAKTRRVGALAPDIPQVW